MTLLTEKNSRTIGTRFSLDLVERITEFAADAGFTLSGAIRFLVDRGLDSNVPLDEMTSLWFNARAEALQRLDKILMAAVEEFQAED